MPPKMVIVYPMWLLFGFDLKSIILGHKTARIRLDIFDAIPNVFSDSIREKNILIAHSYSIAVCARKEVCSVASKIL